MLTLLNRGNIEESSLTATGSTATISDAKTKHSARVMTNPEPIMPATANPYTTGPAHTLHQLQYNLEI